MDVSQIISDLRNELALLDQAIVVLERLDAAPSKKKGRSQVLKLVDRRSSHSPPNGARTKPPVRVMTECG